MTDKILEELSAFASKLNYRELPAVAVAASKDRLLDAVACAIGAQDCDTAAIFSFGHAENLAWPLRKVQNLFMK